MSTQKVEVNNYEIKLIKVVDGDTVDVDIDLGFDVWLRNQRVRLMGIDTPESRTRDLVEKKYGLAAKAYLKEKLKNGAVLRTSDDDDRGKFGRILGEFIVLTDDDVEVNVNQLMITEHTLDSPKMM